MRFSRQEYWNGLPFPSSEYTEELYKKDLHDPNSQDGVITHLEPDILECKVKWALGSIAINKASRGDGILVELFQILKDDSVKVLHSICQWIWKIQQCPQDWKRSVFIPVLKKWSEVTQSCPTLCDSTDCSPPGSSIHGILQARILEQVAISFSRGSSWPRDRSQVSCTEGWFFTNYVKWAQLYGSLNIIYHCPCLGLEWKLTFSIAVTIAEFSKFADILNAGL